MTPRRQLLLLAALFFVARLVLVLCAADRLSEPDAAEVKLMELGDSWIRSGQAPGPTELLRAARAGTNAPHGAYLPVSLGYAALSVPLGDPGNYLALKLVALLFATAAFVVWVLLATALAGPQGGGAMALLLFFPPPVFLAGSMVPWGSHPESVFFLGLAAYLLLRVGRGEKAESSSLLSRSCTALALATAAAMNLLVAPLVAALSLGLAWDHRARLKPWIAPSLLAAGLLVLLLWITGSPWASVTETAGASPLELTQDSPLGGVPLALRSFFALIPLPLGGGAVLPSTGAHGADWGLSALYLVALFGALRISAPRGRLLALFVALPLLHLLCLAVWAPRRPYIPPRYLLPLIPVFLLGLACTWAQSEGRVRRGLVGGALVLAILPGLGLQARLFEPSRISGFSEYRPAAWLAEDIGHVNYGRAPAVNRFLEGRGPGRTLGFNFAAGMGASDALLIEAQSDPRLDAHGLLARRSDALREAPLDGERRALLHENIGWGMAVFAPQGKGTWQAVLSRLEGEDRAALGRGIGLALGWDRHGGCTKLRNFGGPDQGAVIAGFETVRALEDCLGVP